MIPAMRTHARIKIDQSLRFSWLCLFPLVTISASPFADSLQKYFKKAPERPGARPAGPALQAGSGARNHVWFFPCREAPPLADGKLCFCREIRACIGERKYLRNRCDPYCR